MYVVHLSQDRESYTAKPCPTFGGAAEELAAAGNGRIADENNQTLVNVAWGKYPACHAATAGQWVQFLSVLGLQGWADRISVEQ